MKPKEYLLSVGAISEIKRGRLSLPHIEMCKAAAAKGISIEGYSVSTAATAEKPAVVERVKVSTEKVISDIPDYRYPENEFVAHELRNGKKITRSLREACRQTRVSLVVCPCDAHEIVSTDGRTNVRVYIERK